MSGMQTPRGTWTELECKTSVDAEFADTKLRGYERVPPAAVRDGDHIRITQNKRRAPGRECRYLIVKRWDPEEYGWWVNSYNSSYPDRLLPLNPKYGRRQVLFYKKPRPVYTGVCSTCSRAVKKPYLTCYGCRN